ncbi:hypothetical protein IW262DRAFT_539420 [Armillaria fumosa]|nr:hypothetical protein IW262DRAFT_539420 [Armillaria fumosa]
MLRPHFSLYSKKPRKILTEILHRPGSAPLSIALISLPIEPPREETLSDSVSGSLFARLSAQSHRWQSMELTAHDMIWEDFVEISPSRLQALRSLRATVQSGSFLFQIIGVCTSVVDLMICVTDGESRADLPPIPVRMPFLQHLDIRSFQSNVLEAITAPCLQSLRLQTSGSQNSMPSFRSDFVDFVQRSRCSNSLTALDLSGSSCDYRELVAMLSHTSSGDASVPLLLPNLHTLSFDWDGPDVLCAEDLNLILDMVESRVAGRLRNVGIRVGYVFSAEMEKLEGRLSYLKSLLGVTIDFDEIPSRED